MNKHWLVAVILVCASGCIVSKAVKGTGKLAGFTCIHIGPPAMAAEGYDRKNPYCTAAVELDEGPRVVARVEGIDALQPQTITIGTQLQVSFLHRGEGDDVLRAGRLRAHGPELRVRHSAGL